MKRWNLCVVCIFGWCALAAQPRIEVVREGPCGRSCAFNLEGNDYPGTLTVYLTLKEVSNSKAFTGTTCYEVTGSSRRLLTLRPSDESHGVGYKYSWRYLYGRIDPKVDTSLVCRMPVPVRKLVQVIRTVYVLDLYDKRKSEEEQRMLGWQFTLEKGDTVYAMRRGVVTQIKHPEPSAEDSLDVSFTSRSTDIHVEHPDGSIGRYVCLDKNNLFVREGDRVDPSTPLALAGTYDGEHYKVVVNTFWYTQPKRAGEAAGLRYFYPPFATTQGDLELRHEETYIAVLTEEMLTRELSKKELKHFQQKQGR